MAESEIPEDIMDKAADVHRALKFSRDGNHLTEIIAQALLAERNAQKERDAQIAADFNWVLPMYGDMALNSATDDAACSVQEQIAAAIRQDNPNAPKT
jgi:hypothetical protein